MNAELVFLDEKGNPARLPLPEGLVVMGRDTDCCVRIPHPTVSRRHASLVRLGERRMLSDLGSTNGTYVNGNRIDKCLVGEGDHIELGGFCCILRLTRARARLQLQERLISF